jgi:hypothetical protein
MKRDQAIFTRISKENKHWLDTLAEANDRSISAMLDDLLTSIRTEQDLIPRQIGQITDPSVSETLDSIVATMARIAARLERVSK